MKLNERGWGLKSLIIFGTIFLVLLIFTSISISNFFKNNRNSNNSKSNDTVQTTQTTNQSNTNNAYISIEVDIVEAANNYLEYHPTLINNSSSHTIVNVNTLINDDFLDKVIDPNDQTPCDGYVMIKPDGETKAFIKCSGYKTLNYDLWVD